ncbi:MAG: AraC family transcriptional regulator, partial [Clostridiales bacterium]|nr:AraC family transcriptional regulator [Clostridiales bacterium]
QYILRDLLSGSDAANHAINRYAEQYAIVSKPDGHYRIVLMKIDRYRAFVRGNDLPSRSVIQFGIMNIAGELCSERFVTETVDTGEENGLALLISMEREPEGMARAEWESFLSPVADAVCSAFGFGMSFIVSRDCVGLHELHIAFREAKDFAFCRVFRGGGTVILADEVRFSDQEYVYPAAREGVLVDALVSGNAAKAKEVLTSILQDTEKHPYPVINLAVARLALLFSTLAKERQKSGHFQRLAQVNDEILAATSLDDATVTHFLRAIDEIAETTDEKRSSRHADLIARVNRMIEETYGDPNCSVETIAQRIGMSSAHIGRIYKSNTMRSISESIFLFRMKSARLMLREKRRLSVSAIAEKVGFTSSSYFSKTFRKEHGMTPNEFRSREAVGGGAAEGAAEGAGSEAIDGGAAEDGMTVGGDAANTEGAAGAVSTVGTEGAASYQE